MHAMRSLSLVLAVALLAPFALAQHHQHRTISLDTPVPEAVTPTGVTRTFTVVAHQFNYDITPSPFTVNLGDTVVINATSSDVRHGLVMERYVLKALVLDKGKTVTTTFDQPKAAVLSARYALCRPFPRRSTPCAAYQSPRFRYSSATVSGSSTDASSSS